MPDLQMPACPVHSGSAVRRYRSHGPDGPGVYPQCVPGDGEPPHLLSWADVPAVEERRPEVSGLTATEAEVLDDAAHGLTMQESARKRGKGVETVKTQRRSVLLKLGARNMAQAVAMSVSGTASPSRLAA